MPGARGRCLRSIPRSRSPPGPDAAFLPYARNERRRAAVGDPRHARARSTGSAGSRRPTATGNISYDGANHAADDRAAGREGRRDRRECPPLDVDADPDATLLVLGWGSTEGAIRAGGAARRGSTATRSPAPSCDHLNPLPANTGDVLRSFDRVLVPEMNTGQLASGAARPLPGRRRVATQRSRGSRCSPPRSRRRSWSGWDDRADDERRRVRRRRPRADQGGLPVRPGDALVPGLRRLRGAVGRAAVHARARDPARADRVHHRDRLRRAVRLLHGHVRDARHPRPRAGAGDRARDRARATCRSGS